MTRRRKRHAGLLLLILTTAPVFGLLCRGHSPSRFTTPNLPVWERTLPHPAPTHVALHSSPLLMDPLPGNALSETKLARVGSDDLLSAIEHPLRRPPSTTDAGRAGLWLLAACSVNRQDAALRAQQDAVAQRLMEAQRGDGYLAAGTGAGRWSRAQITAYSQNLRGLLAYYAVSHTPAPIYAAIQAGDLVLKRFPDVGANSGRTDSLVSPLALLYQATGETRYRAWAKKRVQAGQTDGSGLCSLYVATGERHYLRVAQHIWRQDCARHRTDEELATALWTLTGAPVYAKAPHVTNTPEHYPVMGRPRAAI